MTIKTLTQYETSDGEIFIDKESAEEHQLKIDRKEEFVKMFEKIEIVGTLDINRIIDLLVTNFEIVETHVKNCIKQDIIPISSEPKTMTTNEIEEELARRKQFKQEPEEVSEQYEPVGLMMKG